MLYRLLRIHGACLPFAHQHCKCERRWDALVSTVVAQARRRPYPAASSLSLPSPLQWPRFLLFYQ